MATMGNFTVRLEKNETADSLIGRFMKKTKKEGLIDEILNRRRYKKPSTRRNEKHFKAIIESKKRKRR